jgi:hypothetical protein
LIVELSLYDKGVIVAGIFHIIEHRKLMHWLRGCDARTYRSFEKGSASIAYLFAGEGTHHELFSAAAQRGVTILTEDMLLDPLRVEWSVDDRLVALRGLLNQPPSEASWRAVCQELELWPAAAGLEIGISYVQGATRGWPDEVLMRSPQRWLKRACASHPDPRLAVVRDLCFEGISLHLSAAPGLMAHSSPELRSLHFTHPHSTSTGATRYIPLWALHRTSLDARTLAAVLSHPNAASLRRINLDGASLGNGCLDALRAAKLPLLESISARYTGRQRADFNGVSHKIAVTV